MAAAVLLVATGCSVAPPPVADAGVEAPSVYTATPPPEPAAESAPPAAPEAPSAAEPWWTSFGDPALDALVAEVLEANHGLAAAAERVAQAAAQARIAGAALLPQAGAGDDAVRQRRNFVGFPIPSGGSVLSTTNTTLGTALNVSWEADLWGRLRAGEAAAAAGVAAAEADLAAARLSLAGQAAKAWFALVESARQVELAAETLDNRRRSTERIRRAFRAGLRPALDLRLAAAAEAAAEAALAARERRLDAARRQLEILRSVYPAGARRGAEAAELPPPPAAMPAGLPAELVARRPDLAALERRLEAAGWRIGEARAALRPGLRLTGSAGRLGEELEDLLESDFSVWSLAASLLQPLYQGGRLRAGVDLAEARYRELAESWAQAVLAAFAEVELALAGEAALARQEASLAEAARQALAARGDAEERYQAGLADVLAVLAAQREANDARARLLEARRQRLETRIDLHLALGGGWEAPAPGASPDAAARAATPGSSTAIGASATHPTPPEVPR